MRAIIALMFLLIASPAVAGCGFLGLQHCAHRAHHHRAIRHKTIVQHLTIVRHIIIKKTEPRWLPEPLPNLAPIPPVK